MLVLLLSHLCCNAFPTVFISTIPYQTEKGKRMLQSWAAVLIVLWFCSPFWYAFSGTCATNVLQLGLSVQLDVVKVRLTLHFAARFGSCFVTLICISIVLVAHFFFLVIFWKEAVTLWHVLGILENGNCDQGRIACHWVESCILVLQKCAGGGGNWAGPSQQGRVLKCSRSFCSTWHWAQLSRSAVLWCLWGNVFEWWQKMLENTGRRGFKNNSNITIKK